MTIADKLKSESVRQFLEACEALENDERFADQDQLIPFAAAVQVLVWHTERLAMRTEIECKKEIYRALQIDPPSDSQLLQGQG